VFWLSDMEQDQMTDIRASIHGRGSYQLTGQAQVLQVSNESWIQLTPDQKMRRLNRLLTFKSKSSVSVTSTISMNKSLIMNFKGSVY
jgi:hypothetical protein